MGVTTDPYGEPQNLWAALAEPNGDDVRLLRSIIEPRQIRSVHDYCGGHGRARRHWPEVNVDWCVVDRSIELLDLGKRHPAAGGVRWVQHDFNNGARLLSPTADLGICLNNSLNELTRLDYFGASCATNLKPAARLFTKLLSFDNEPPARGKNDLGTVCDRDGDTWRARALANFTATPANDASFGQQDLRLEFVQIGSERRVDYQITRIIWRHEYFQRLMAAYGFALAWATGGFALFEKSDEA